MTKPKAAASSSPRPGARWSTRTRSSFSASASISARRPRIWCSRASCWSGSTAATSSPLARPSTSPTSCSRPMRPRRRSTPRRSAPSSSSQYQDANVDPDEIDTGALILTGVAVRRRNARKIGELFARQAGKMVAVSAGDSLETVMAAYGSGAVARSIRDKATVMNVDIGGGTSKIAVCADGQVIDLTALDVGARLVCLDRRRPHRARRGGRPPLRRRARHQPRARRGACAGGGARAGRRAWRSGCSRRCAGERRPRAAPACCGSIRCPLPRRSTRSRSPAASPNTSTAAKRTTFGDLGVLLAQEIRARVAGWGPKLERSNEGIRATVIGASQYTTQVSGSTIYVSPLDALPLRNVPVIAPRLALDADEIDSAGGGGSDHGGAQAPRSRRGRHAGRGVRAVARLGDLPAARRLLPGRGRRRWPRSLPTATRWCWPATATSAA